MSWLKKPVTSLRPTWNYGVGKFPNYTSLYVNVPHCIPVVLAAAFTIVPWHKSVGRFSLRTLLLAVTLVAVALGMIFALAP